MQSRCSIPVRKLLYAWYDTGNSGIHAQVAADSDGWPPTCIEVNLVRPDSAYKSLSVSLGACMRMEKSSKPVRLARARHSCKLYNRHANKLKTCSAVRLCTIAIAASLPIASQQESIRVDSPLSIVK